MTAGTARSRTVTLLAGVLLALHPWPAAGLRRPAAVGAVVRRPSPVALVAQSVPSAAYVPCITDPPHRVVGLPGFRARTRRHQFRTSVRVWGRWPRGECAVDGEVRCQLGASPEPARMVGSRTFLRLQRISPRYTGTLYDIFPAGA